MKSTIKCNECESLFFEGASSMSALCPECSHHLYGYENCKHEITEGHCIKCYWDESKSNYIEKVNHEQKLNK